MQLETELHDIDAAIEIRDATLRCEQQASRAAQGLIQQLRSGKMEASILLGRLTGLSASLLAQIEVSYPELSELTREEVVVCNDSPSSPVVQQSAITKLSQHQAKYSFNINLILYMVKHTAAFGTHGWVGD